MLKKLPIHALVLSILLLMAPHAALAAYKYAHAEAEYIVELPEAPLAETIWAQNRSVPYIENPPKYGALGEIATVKRVDPTNGDAFYVVITFVKSDRDYLLSLDEEKLKDILKKDMSNVMLEDAKFSCSQGTGTLKWATLSGFSVDKNNAVLFNTEHFLVGEGSIMVLRVSYSVENPTYSEYYKVLSESITYIGR